MNAVDARFQTGLLGLVLGIARFARWDIRCGFCQEQFRKVQPLVWSSSVCPYCGTRNLLPVPRFPNDPGPRPPNWPGPTPPSH
jgi:DNA-directed RNA polymerase subunit RPC12/RpoP